MCCSEDFRLETIGLSCGHTKSLGHFQPEILNSGSSTPAWKPTAAHGWQWVPHATVQVCKNGRPHQVAGLQHQLVLKLSRILVSSNLSGCHLWTGGHRFPPSAVSSVVQLWSPAMKKMHCNARKSCLGPKHKADSVHIALLHFQEICMVLHTSTPPMLFV